MTPKTARRIFKPLVFAVCLIPLGLLVWNLFQNNLGPNPIETLNRTLGDWALRFLLITLAIRPLAEITGWRTLVAYRRMIGLYAFFYAVCHVSNYQIIDLRLDFAAFLADIVKRNYITVGMVALTLLIPLAVTSTKGWVKRLGGRRWNKLHMLVYGIAVLGVFHYYMMTRADFREPLIYGAILALMLGYRVVVARRRARARAGAASQT